MVEGRFKGQVSESRRDYENEFSVIFKKYSGRLKTARGCLDVMKELVAQGPDILSTSEWDTIDRRFKNLIENISPGQYDFMMQQYNKLVDPLEEQRHQERLKKRMRNPNDYSPSRCPVEISIVRTPFLRGI